MPRYTRFLRDEVLAELEWQPASLPRLHVRCHVRGDRDWWLAPSPLRLFIFRREMGLVLDAVRFADSDFLADHPGSCMSALMPSEFMWLALKPPLAP